MAITMSFDAAPAPIGPVGAGLSSVPTTRTVPSLEAAMREIRRLGGTVTSDTRTAPGIGSWAFVADATGVEVVIWEDSPPTGS